MFVISVTVIPEGTLVAVTVREPAPSCESETTAMVEEVPVAPFSRPMLSPLMAGGVFAEHVFR
ncbi:MAG: hypothetical protein LC708_02150, partial [Actinobacteria bacterium]|nr:hypothetical protein [Actinomycetota bacterium]